MHAWAACVRACVRVQHAQQLRSCCCRGRLGCSGSSSYMAVQAPPTILHQSPQACTPVSGRLRAGVYATVCNVQCVWPPLTHRSAELRRFLSHHGHPAAACAPSFITACRRGWDALARLCACMLNRYSSCSWLVHRDKPTSACAGDHACSICALSAPTHDLAGASPWGGTCCGAVQRVGRSRHRRPHRVDAAAAKHLALSGRPLRVPVPRHEVLERAGRGLGRLLRTPVHWCAPQGACCARLGMWQPACCLPCPHTAQRLTRGWDLVCHDWHTPQHGTSLVHVCTPR